MIYSHPACLEHDPGSGHPESPQRLAAVLEALSDPTLRHVPRATAAQATREQLARTHSAQLIDALFSHAPNSGLLRLDADTAMSSASLEAALRAAGAACAAVDAVLDGAAQRAFCAVRPPGHHATRDRAMGFCLFNNVAVAAHHALASHGLQRIAIVDFDVHHGNGTEDIFRNDRRVLYASSHQWPLYPGSGDPRNNVSGHLINVGLPPGSGSEVFRQVYSERVFPELRAFAPQLLLISAGFDAHWLDPLASINLSDDDYAWISARLVEIAEQSAQGRVVSVLEGGYSLTALRRASLAHCQALFGATT